MPNPVYVPTPTVADPYLIETQAAVWALDAGCHLSVFAVDDEPGLRLAFSGDPDVMSISAADGAFVLTKAVTVEQIDAWIERLRKVAAARRAANQPNGDPR